MFLFFWKSEVAIAIVALILEAGARCELNVCLVSSAGRLVIFGSLLGGWIGGILSLTMA